jgi:hypothetical protein
MIEDQCPRKTVAVAFCLEYRVTLRQIQRARGGFVANFERFRNNSERKTQTNFHATANRLIFALSKEKNDKTS